MVTYYNKKDLVSFGKYLLSDERKVRLSMSSSSVPVEERMKNITQADVQNWIETQKKTE